MYASDGVSAPVALKRFLGGVLPVKPEGETLEDIPTVELLDWLFRHQSLKIKEATKATIRCIPLESEGPAPEPGRCVKTGRPSERRVLFARNY